MIIIKGDGDVVTTGVGEDADRRTREPLRKP